MMMVLDTSCISAFIRAGRVELLLKILGKHDVVITEQVQMELRLGKIDALRNFTHPKIQTRRSSSLPEKYGIHLGEASVIGFAKDNKAVAVINDKKARLAAEAEGIDYIGTATLLKLAITNKIAARKEMEKIIEEIVTLGRLYLTQEIKSWILE